jgi:hypothetical protein
MGIALPSALCDITQVLEFLGMRTGTPDETRLNSLIANLTQYLQQYLSRDFALQYNSELRNGNGQQHMFVLNPPVQNFYGAYFLGAPMATAPDDMSGGVVWDEEKVMLRGNISVVGSRASMPSYYQTRFPVGSLNIRFNYASGWLLPNQFSGDWSASLPYYPRALIQPSMNNPGAYLFAFNRRSSKFGQTSGATAPVFPQTAGATVVDGGVTWTNLGLTALPDELPLSLQEACLELVATRYKQAPHWIETGTGLGPERVNFFIKGVSDGTLSIINTFNQVAPIAR